MFSICNVTVFCSVPPKYSEPSPPVTAQLPDTDEGIENPCDTEIDLYKAGFVNVTVTVAENSLKMVSLSILKSETICAEDNQQLINDIKLKTVNKRAIFLAALFLPNLLLLSSTFFGSDPSPSMSESTIPFHSSDRYPVSSFLTRWASNGLLPGIIISD